MEMEMIVRDVILGVGSTEFIIGVTNRVDPGEETIGTLCCDLILYEFILPRVGQELFLESDEELWEG